jgi:hypothetical protein
VERNWRRVDREGERAGWEQRGGKHRGGYLYHRDAFADMDEEVLGVGA